MKKSYIEPNVEVINLLHNDAIMASNQEGISRDEWDVVGGREFF